MVNAQSQAQALRRRTARADRLALSRAPAPANAPPRGLTDAEPAPEPLEPPPGVRDGKDN